MIVRIVTKTAGDFFIIEDETGNQHQLDEDLVLTASEYSDLLEDVRDSWDIVEGFSEDADASKSFHQDDAAAITALVQSGDAFEARTASGSTIPLTPVELKTILNARDIHNAKVRGVEPPSF